MIIEDSCIETTVFHQRHHPNSHNFSHQVLFLLLNIEQKKHYKSRLFSFNKFNIFSVSLLDYEMGETRKTLGKFNVNPKNILLLTMPKFCGYVFNPVSFFLCFNQKEQLIAVLAEVHNTFNERHTYLCFHDDLTPIAATDILQKEKVLHVSPFCQVTGYYKFRFAISEKTVNIDIDYYINDQKLISTSMKGTRQAIKENVFIKYFFLSLFVPFKVIFLIHFQAFCLWCKKVPYFRKPEKHRNNIS